MRIVYPNANKFKTLTQVLAKVVDEAPFFVKETGVFVKSLSEDKTTMIVFNIPASVFEEYEVEEQVAFSVSTRELNRVSRRGTRNDKIELNLDKEARVLRMVFRDKKTDVVRMFEIPVSLDSVEEVGEPKVDLPVKLDMIAGDFKDIIADAKLVGEEIVIEYHGDEIRIKSEGAGRTYETLLKKGEPLISLASDTGEAVAKYSVELLAATTKAATSGATLSISFGQDLPLRLSLEIEGVGSLVYWVAPRM